MLASYICQEATQHNSDTCHRVRMQVSSALLLRPRMARLAWGATSCYILWGSGAELVAHPRTIDWKRCAIGIDLIMVVFPVAGGP